MVIYNDIQDTTEYIPQGLTMGILFLLILWLYTELTGRDTKLDWKRSLFWFFGIIYTSILMNIVFLSREPGSRTGVDLCLFGTWGDSAQAQGYVIENILLFIPVGLLLPGMLRPLHNGFLCILACSTCSVGIELLQFVTERGYCQLDDVVMNTAGAGIGWVFYRVIVR